MFDQLIYCEYISAIYDSTLSLISINSCNYIMGIPVADFHRIRRTYCPETIENCCEVLWGATGE